MNYDDIDAARAEFYDRAAITGSARYVRDHDLDPDTIEARAGCLGLVRGEMRPDRRWDFRADGKALAVIEVFGSDDETTIDLAAWSADGDPTHVATMFGEAAVLGEARVENPETYFGGKPLQVHGSALEWLAAGCLGVVVLDPGRAVDVLAEAPGRIAGRDHDHSRHLARLLRHYVDPRRVVAPLRRAA